LKTKLFFSAFALTSWSLQSQSDIIVQQNRIVTGAETAHLQLQ